MVHHGPRTDVRERIGGVGCGSCRSPEAHRPAPQIFSTSATEAPGRPHPDLRVDVAFTRTGALRRSRARRRRPAVALVLREHVPAAPRTSPGRAAASTRMATDAPAARARSRSARSRTRACAPTRRRARSLPSTSTICRSRRWPNCLNASGNTTTSRLPCASSSMNTHIRRPCASSAAAAATRCRRSRRPRRAPRSAGRCLPVGSPGGPRRHARRLSGNRRAPARSARGLAP